MEVKLIEIIDLCVNNFDVDIFGNNISFHGNIEDDETFNFIEEHKNDFVRGVRFEPHCLYIELVRT